MRRGPTRFTTKRLVVAIFLFVSGQTVEGRVVARLAVIGGCRNQPTLPKNYARGGTERAISHCPTATLTTTIAEARLQAAIVSPVSEGAAEVDGLKPVQALTPTAISRRHETQARLLRGGRAIKAGADGRCDTGISR